MSDNQTSNPTENLSDENPCFPFVRINDIARAIGQSVSCHTGNVSACASLVIALADGRSLTIQTGDTSDHYRIACD